MTEDKDEHRDGEDERTKGKAHIGRQPPQRQLPAIIHRFFMNAGHWQTMVGNLVGWVVCYSGPENIT